MYTWPFMSVHLHSESCPFRSSSGGTWGKCIQGLDLKCHKCQNLGILQLVCWALVQWRDPVVLMNGSLLSTPEYQRCVGVDQQLQSTWTSLPHSRNTQSPLWFSLKYHVSMGQGETATVSTAVALNVGLRLFSWSVNPLIIFSIFGLRNVKK